MASESTLKELFNIAKNSSPFKGMSDKEIWDACLAYRDRSDEDIRIAMKNIQEKDSELVEKSEEHKKLIEENKIKMDELKKKEGVDREKDKVVAEEILEKFFSS